MTDPPVLLVHGFASSFDRNWREPGWVDLLGDAGRAVIGPDLPGHGRAPKHHEPAAYADMEKAVAAELPDEPVDAIGFSMGARVILTLASQTPERFRRIVVGGVGANLFRDDDHERIAQALENGPADDDVVGRLFVQLATGAGNDTRALAAFLRRPERPLTADALGAIDKPVLVVLGDRDFAGPADPLLDALPDATLVTLPGADHFATPKDFRFIDAALAFIGAQL